MNQSTHSLQLGDLATASPSELDGNSFFVEAKGFRYPVKLKLQEGADKLFIMLNGAVDRSKTPLPVFARWNYGKILGGHVLAVCDPTLYLSESLPLGWFLGSPDSHAISGLVSVAETFRECLGVAPGRMIFYGSSGGGFAAMIAACHCMQGRAIAINPQTDIFRYYPRILQTLIDYWGGESQVADSLSAYPERWQVMPSLAQARTGGMMTKMLIAQNIDDRFHYEKHYIPFVDSEGIPENGGVNSDGSIMAMTFSSTKGHGGGEPPEVVRSLVSEGVPFLCDVI